MNRLPMEPVSPEIESLLDAERVLVPAPTEVRTRAIQRARTALPRRPRASLCDQRRSANPRRARIFVAAAAGLMLVAVGAAAFHAGYQTRAKVTSASTTTPTPGPPIPDPQRPAALPASPSETNAVVAAPLERAAKTKSTTPPRAATDSDAYAIELRLLQKAHQGVTRHDFASALTVIAEHQRRFASGQLVEEREALRVKALLGLGRTAEAQRAGAVFRERFPRSVLLRRIEGMLEASP
jgi:hypothetical protein